MAYAARQALTEAAVRQPGTRSSNGDTDERDVGQTAGPAAATAPLLSGSPLTGTAPIVICSLVYFVRERYDCAGALICPGLEPGISGSGGRRLIH